MTNSERSQRVRDHAVEQRIGRLLQIGVLAAAFVVAAGAGLLLRQHGSAAADYSVFRGEPDGLRSVVAVTRGAMAGRSDAIVQLGLLMLIATPIARVAFTLGAFALQRDRMYVVITAIVLGLLLYGLLFSRA